MCIFLGNAFWDPLTQIEAKQKVDELSNILRSDKDWEIQKIITDTRVPIIRGLYCPMNLECNYLIS